MPSEEVKLVSFQGSLYAQRVVLALEAKGIKYEIIPEDMRNKSQLLLESNPVYKKIPVLLHNGKPVCESSIIVQYIDEVWPGDNDTVPSFLPKDPFAKTTARFWAAFIDTKLLDSTWKAVQTQDFAEFIENVTLLEGALEKSKADPFFGGNTVSLPDIILAPLAVWIPALVEVAGLQLPGPDKLPLLHRLLEAIRELPAGAAALPELEKHIGFVRSIRKMFTE